MSIALGLGIYAAVDLSTTYLIDRVPALTGAFQIFANLVYLGAASLWAYSLAKPEPARSNVLDSPRRLIFQRWNEALLLTASAVKWPLLPVEWIRSFPALSKPLIAFWLARSSSKNIASKKLQAGHLSGLFYFLRFLRDLRFASASRYIDNDIRCPQPRLDATGPLSGRL